MQPEFTAKTNKVYFFQMGYSIFNRFQSRHFCVPRCSSILFFAWLCFYFCFLFFLLACSFLELKGLAWGQKKKDNALCTDCLSASGQQELVTKTQCADCSKECAQSCSSIHLLLIFHLWKGSLRKQEPCSWDLVYLMLIKEGWCQ